MSDSERAENPSASARSTHVAHFMPPAWPIVASRLAPLIARVDRDADAVQVLILVPAAPDATALFRALSDLNVAETASIALLATPRRSRRLTSAAKAQVVVGTPAVVHGLVSASALSLAAVTGVGIVAADELESDSPMLDLVLAELPRGAAKTLIATSSSAFVDKLIEAQMHGARRLPAAAPEPGTTAPPPIEYIPTSAESPAATLGDVLEIVDAPSAAVVPADSAREQAARTALASLGYPPDSPLARVARDGASGGAALVVLIGAPNTEQWAAVMAAPPARLVALVTTRERSALAGVVPGARLVPFSPSGARGDAAAAEEALRDRIRRAIGESYPAREMLALEPLLGEFDALVLAGAALRMFERERESARRLQEARPAAPRPAAPRPAAPRPAAAAPSERSAPARSGFGARPARSDDRGRPPRGDDRGRPPRGDDRGRPPRGADRGRPPRGDDRDRPPRRDDRGRPPRTGDRSTRSPRDRR